MSVVAACVALLFFASTAVAVPPPREVLGIDVGNDRVLASYQEAGVYLRALAAESERVRIVEMGKTVEGRTMLAAVVGSPANLARLDALKRGWAALADPRGLSAGEAGSLAAELPTCVLITAGIHATEVAGPQAALLFAHRLASAPAGSREAGWLERVVVLLVPSLNPDGQEAVVAWYRRWLGTPYEGCSPPFLAHRFAGHDNNRDFVYLTQPESQALNRFVYREWHPQLFLDLHQMGISGPRQFVPPFADPIAPNVHPMVWWVTSHLGSLMSWRLGEGEKSGVVSGWVFDGNWIGGTRNTAWWKNVFGVLTETASAALASPLEVDANELSADGKGLTEYRAQVNFPKPWRGGRWGLADAVSYQSVVMGAFVEFAALHGTEVLRDASAMAAEAVARGGREMPRAFLVAPLASDPGRANRLVELVLEGGVEAQVAPQGVTADGVAFPPGTVVFLAAQPLRQYLVEVLGRQTYPEILPATGADILQPYDITSWSMPLAFGVPVVAATVLDGSLEPLRSAPGWPRERLTGAGPVALCEPGEIACFSFANGALAAGGRVGRTTASTQDQVVGSFVVEGLRRDLLATLAEKSGARVQLVDGRLGDVVPLRRVAVGVYTPDFPVEDAGWCRFVLERAGFTVEVVDNRQAASGDLKGRIDVLVVPPLEGKNIAEGPSRRPAVPSPPEFRGGLGGSGTAAVERFFADGGTVIGFGASAEWLAELLALPVTNPLRGAPRHEYSAPGAHLSLVIEPTTALTWGMPPRVAAMVDWACALTTRPVGGETRRIVGARFPDEPLVLSGWLRGEQRLRGRAAAVEVRSGRGRAVLFSFSPYFRGQSLATFPLLFNAVMTEMSDPPIAGRQTR